MKQFIGVLLLLLLPTLAHAQLFKAGLVAGFNAAQVDGDNYGGFTKFGVNGGFIAQMDLSDRLFLNFELLFSQKGSNSGFREDPNFPDRFNLITNYADIPILVRYHDLKGGITFGGGISVSRLVGSKYIDSLGEDSSDFVFAGAGKPRTWDFGGILDFTYMFNPVWGINLRFNNSFIYFRQDPASAFRNQGQYHRLVSMRTVFLFSAIGKK